MRCGAIRCGVVRRGAALHKNVSSSSPKGVEPDEANGRVHDQVYTMQQSSGVGGFVWSLMEPV